jgi:hypothetical protein
MIEIYNRDPGDPLYKENILEVTDPIEICIGQLKMCLLTNKGEVLGDVSFGMNLDNMIFELALSEQSIKSELNIHLNTYASIFFDLGGYYELEFYQGTERDIAYLDFFLPSYGGENPIISLKYT